MKKGFIISCEMDEYGGAVVYVQMRSLSLRCSARKTNMELAATPEGFVLPNSPSVAVELWAGRGRIESLRVHRDEAFLSLLPDEPHVYSARQARVVCNSLFSQQLVPAVPAPSCARSSSEFLCWKTHTWCVVKALGNPLVFWGALTLAALFLQC